jgi:hypothetical protein
MLGMKERITLSLERETAEYLTRKAQESGTNLSAYVDRYFRHAALAESVASHAAWYTAHPGYADDSEAERSAAGAV